MARTVNVVEQAARRDAILDAAQHRILAKGYERLTIQDILDDLEISKGAFYHYFESKLAVVGALTGSAGRRFSACSCADRRGPGIRSSRKAAPLLRRNHPLEVRPAEPHGGDAGLSYAQATIFDWLNHIFERGHPPAQAEPAAADLFVRQFAKYAGRAGQTKARRLLDVARLI